MPIESGVGLGRCLRGLQRAQLRMKDDRSATLAGLKAGVKASSANLWA